MKLELTKKGKIAKYLKENEAHFDKLNFLDMSRELKRFHGVDANTTQIGKVYDEIYGENE